jgi:hypothetical protein
MRKKPEGLAEVAVNGTKVHCGVFCQLWLEHQGLKKQFQAELVKPAFLLHRFVAL